MPTGKRLTFGRTSNGAGSLPAGPALHAGRYHTHLCCLFPRPPPLTLNLISRTSSEPMKCTDFRNLTRTASHPNRSKSTSRPPKGPSASVDRAVGPSPPCLGRPQLKVAEQSTGGERSRGHSSGCLQSAGFSGSSADRCQARTGEDTPETGSNPPEPASVCFCVRVQSPAPSDLTLHPELLLTVRWGRAVSRSVDAAAPAGDPGPGAALAPPGAHARPPSFSSSVSISRSSHPTCWPLRYFAKYTRIRSHQEAVRSFCADAEDGAAVFITAGKPGLGGRAATADVPCLSDAECGQPLPKGTLFILSFDVISHFPRCTPPIVSSQIDPS